jgi:hypothetical protein
VFADGLRHLEHVQSGLSKDWFQLFIGYDLTPLLWVLQFVRCGTGLSANSHNASLLHADYTDSGGSPTRR